MHLERVQYRRGYDGSDSWIGSLIYESRDASACTPAATPMTIPAGVPILYATVWQQLKRSGGKHRKLRTENEGTSIGVRDQ